MSGFIVGADRNQATLFPESLDDYVAEESAVRVIDVFVDELDLRKISYHLGCCFIVRNEASFHMAWVEGGISQSNRADVCYEQ